MAAAIPAAIGVGSSIVGGIQGKGAAKRQEKLAQQQMAQLQPLINAQLAASQFGLNQAQQLYPQAIQRLTDTYGQAQGAFGQAGEMTNTAMTDYRKLLNDALGKSDQLFGQGQGLMDQGQGLLGGSQNYLTGAASALSDLQQFYRPFMYDGQRAIDKFLPGQQQLNKLLAGDFANVNQGYKSASENIASFAPRGGGRVSSLANADVDRQRQITQLGAQGRQSLLQTNLQNAFQGAQGQQNIAQQLQALGLGQGQLGLGTIGAGLNTIGAGNQALATGGGLAQNSFGQGLQSFGQGLNALNLGLGAGQSLGNLAQGSMGMGLQGGNQAYDMYNQQANRAYGGSPQPNTSAKGLGGFLTDLFQTSPVQGGVDKIFKGIFGGGGSTTSMPPAKIPGG